MRAALVIFVFALIETESSIIYSSSENIKTLSANEKEWWQTASFYQIYVRSFKDSNKDGIGDINGIIEKLDYIQSLRVQAVILSSLYVSKNVDFGYDITNYESINSEYGTLDDFQVLLEEAHKRDIKVIVDFIPNHTSTKHQWFIVSQVGGAKNKDYYVWADGIKNEKTGEMDPPNNWVSVFKGSAWKWEIKRNQYYLHTFQEDEPDLNYRLDAVKEEMKNVLSFWLTNYEIDGIRIVGASYLVEDTHLRDEPLSNIDGTTPEDYEYLKHIYTKNQPESFDIVYEWRELLDDIVKQLNKSKIIIVDSDDPNYCENQKRTRLGAHFNLNYQFLSLTKSSTATDLLDLINQWYTSLPESLQSNWMLGTQDIHRLASRVDNLNIDGLNMLTSFLPGIKLIYNGEEIGMTDGDVDCTTQGQDLKNDCSKYDLLSRDFERTPFQWNSTDNGGFSENSNTWLPVNKDYIHSNVAGEEKDPNSHLNIFVQLQNLRHNLSDLNGMYMDVLNGSNTLHIVRYKNSTEDSEYVQYNFLFNLNGHEDKDLYMDTSLNFPKYKVVLKSGKSTRNIGDVIYPEHVSLGPHEALILTPLPIDNHGSRTISIEYTTYFTLLILVSFILKL